MTQAGTSRDYRAGGVVTKHDLSRQIDAAWQFASGSADPDGGIASNSRGILLARGLLIQIEGA